MYCSLLHLLAHGRKYSMSLCWRTECSQRERRKHGYLLVFSRWSGEWLSSTERVSRVGLQGRGVCSLSILLCNVKFVFKMLVLVYYTSSVYPFHLLEEISLKNISLGEIHITIISYFKVYNSVTFNTFALLCNHHFSLVSKHFYHLKR